MSKIIPMTVPTPTSTKKEKKRTEPHRREEKKKKSWLTGFYGSYDNSFEIVVPLGVAPVPRQDLARSNRQHRK
jgi:hypothetical protein